MMALDVEILNNDNTITYSLTGDFKTLDAINFKEKLLSELNGSENRNYKINLYKVKEMDITALNSLIVAKRFANKHYFNFTVNAPDNHMVNQLLKVTHFTNFLPIMA